MGESAHNAPVVLVTGGAAGIGRAVADRFLGGGWRVHIGDTDLEAVQRFRGGSRWTVLLCAARGSAAEGGRRRLDSAHLFERGGLNGCVVVEIGD